MAETQADVTRLLVEWSQGEKRALDELTPLTYVELRRLADRYLRGERPGDTLQSTALVHEAWMKRDWVLAKARLYRQMSGRAESAT